MRKGGRGGSLFIISLPRLIPSSWDPSMCVCVCRLELNNKSVVVKLEVEGESAQRMAEIQGRVAA